MTNELLLTLVHSSTFISRPNQSTASNVHSALLAISAAHVDERPWSDMNRPLGKVHVHCCGHATYTDTQILLQRNGQWSEFISKYVAETQSRCPGCNATAKPMESRKVSLSKLSSTSMTWYASIFFWMIYVNFMRCTQQPGTPQPPLNQICHSSQQYLLLRLIGCQSSGLRDPSKATRPLSTKRYLLIHALWTHPSDQTSPKTSKNQLESKHYTIRNVYFRLKADCGDGGTVDHRLLAIKSVHITNDLYVSGILSAAEMAKGYRKPAELIGYPCSSRKNSYMPLNILLAKRKLALIMRSKMRLPAQFYIGDLVDLCIKIPNEKRGLSTSPRSVHAIDRMAGIITVPGANGKTFSAAVEDVRP